MVNTQCIESFLVNRKQEVEVIQQNQQQKSSSSYETNGGEKPTELGLSERASFSHWTSGTEFR
jgi:hypothetical protein